MLYILYMNMKLDDNIVLLGDALTRFTSAHEGEVTGLGLSLREKKFACVRLAILSAVLRLTKERSLADISVREICELAQVAPATFFNYFPSKEDVLVYYMRLWSIPITLQCRAVAVQGTVLDAIAAVFDYTARETEQNPRLMFEIIAIIAHAKERGRGCRTAVHRRVVHCAAPAGGTYRSAVILCLHRDRRAAVEDHVLWCPSRDPS